MILELADFFPLASKASRKAKKTAKTQIKVARKEAKVAKKTAKISGRVARKENKAVRKTSRSDRRTTRVKNKEERKDKKQLLKIAKKDTKLLRVANKQDRMNARNEEKLDNIKKATYSPEYNAEENDSIPNEIYDQVPGGSFMPDNSDYYPESESEVIDTDYDIVPDDEQEEEYQEEEMGELSAPFLLSVLKGAKNLITKASQSKVGKSVSKQIDYKKINQQLTFENSTLKQQVKNLETQRYIIGGVAFAAGAGTGYFIKRK